MHELARKGSAGRPSPCAQCGQPIAGSARFCGACGAVAPDPEAAVSPIPFPRIDTEPETRPVELGEFTRPSRRRVVVPILWTVLAATLVSAALLGWNDVQTHHHLTATHGHLTSARSSLTRVGADLSATQTRLAATQSELDTTQADLDQTKQSLAAVKQRLGGVSNSLSDAKSRLNVQSGQIETLKSCLNGVSLALSDAAYGDYSSAVSALDAVRVSCDAAYKILN